MRISPPETETSRFFTYPGARAPDRQRTVDAGGIALTVYEWGDIAAPPRPCSWRMALSTLRARSMCLRRCWPS